MELAGKSILVVGLGRSGRSAARFLNRNGAKVRILDSDAAVLLSEEARRLTELGIDIEGGSHSADRFRQADLIVLSPGVSHELPAVREAERNGIPVIGELELASRFIREPIVAVSGTNGKTTTTTLVGDMLKMSGRPVFVGGNIGTPLVEYMDLQTPAHVVVAEVSSFQLDTIDTFCPEIGVLLNIAPDHQDRYTDFEAYAAAKARLFENQTGRHLAVLNGADPVIKAVCSGIRSRRAPFFPPESRPPVTGGGAWFESRRLILQANCGQPESNGRLIEFDLAKSRLRGRHNMENLAAAALAGLAAGASPDAIQGVIERFTGLPHRLETVVVHQGVEYIDDSKATNVDAVSAALTAFSNPVILIMGGRDKGGDFSKLAPRIRRQVKRLIVMGEAAPALETALGSQTDTSRAVSMEEAVIQARQSAISGDTVLLSPGCTSFDMYANYAERGDDFHRAAEKMAAQ